MHEITLCQNAVEIMVQQARVHGASKVTAVWLELGAFSCVEPESLQFCFELVCRETLAEGCQLHLIMLPAQCWCGNCQQDVRLTNTQQMCCPQCSGALWPVNANDGMKIKRLEIE
jgi:hydrogenase nickel incorporation protein HypA/HybF